MSYVALFFVSKEHTQLVLIVGLVGAMALVLAKQFSAKIREKNRKKLSDELDWINSQSDYIIHENKTVREENIPNLSSVLLHNSKLLGEFSRRRKCIMKKLKRV